MNGNNYLDSEQELVLDADGRTMVRDVELVGNMQDMKFSEKKPEMEVNDFSKSESLVKIFPKDGNVGIMLQLISSNDGILTIVPRSMEFVEKTESDVDGYSSMSKLYDGISNNLTIVLDTFQFISISNNILENMREDTLVISVDKDYELNINRSQTDKSNNMLESNDLSSYETEKDNSNNGLDDMFKDYENNINQHTDVIDNFQYKKDID